MVDPAYPPRLPGPHPCCNDTSSRAATGRSVVREVAVAEVDRKGSQRRDQACALTIAQPAEELALGREVGYGDFVNQPDAKIP